MGLLALPTAIDLCPNKATSSPVTSIHNIGKNSINHENMHGTKDSLTVTLGMSYLKSVPHALLFQTEW